MCTIWYHKIIINKIMSLALNMRLDYRPAAFDELVQLCVVALQVYYDGACPEERGNLLLGTLHGGQDYRPAKAINRCQWRCARMKRATLSAQLS
jgi:hypothetical protein